MLTELLDVITKRVVSQLGTNQAAHVTERMATVDFASGTLTATTAIQSMAGARLPATITLKSADATRKIELSTDGGTEYFTPTYDQNSTTMLVVTVTSSVTHVRFTGIVGNTWSVL